jgi:hypothetical protein
MQGAANQQGMAGQAAVMQAQQQLAAQQALQQQQAQMVNQQHGALGMYGNQAQANQGQLMKAQMEANKRKGDLFGGLLGGVAGALAGPVAGLFGGGQKPAGTQIAGESSDNSVFAYSGGVIPGPKSFVGQHLARGGNVLDFRSGGKLPGKAAVAGDSLKNDKVPIMGSPGEIMLPRSVTMSDNAGEKAKAFVEKVKAKNRMKK